MQGGKKEGVLLLCKHVSKFFLLFNVLKQNILFFKGT